MYIYEVVEDLSENIDGHIIENEFELHKNVLTENSIKEILEDNCEIEFE